MWYIIVVSLINQNRSQGKIICLKQPFMCCFNEEDITQERINRLSLGASFTPYSLMPFSSHFLNIHPILNGHDFRQAYYHRINTF